jgi:hypothetical protein
MATTRAPAHAVDAAGTLSELLTFSHSGTRNTIRRKPQARADPSQPQKAYRTWMAWLIRAWGVLAEFEKNTWNESARAAGLSPYHFFLKYNAARWTHGLFPTKKHPATLGPPAISYSNRTTEVGRRYCQMSLNVGARPHCWCLAWYRRTGPYYIPKPTDLIAMNFGIAVTYVPLIDNTAIPGVTYRYMFQIGSTTGLVFFNGSSDILTATA